MMVKKRKDSKQWYQVYTSILMPNIYKMPTKLLTVERLVIDSKDDSNPRVLS